MGPMKITPTLILLLNFLLHGDKLQQIFVSGYWHALPAVIYYVGVVSYVDHQTKLEKYYDRLIKNHLGRKVCEAVLLWIFLSLNFYGWIFVQRLIYRSVRAWLTKSPVQNTAPLAILWQPEPTWRDLSSQNSDNIAFVVALMLSSVIMACCVSSSGGWNKRWRSWLCRDDPLTDSQWPPMVWPWSRSECTPLMGGVNSNFHADVEEEADEDDEFRQNVVLSPWGTLKRTLNVWPTSMDPDDPTAANQRRHSYAPLPDFIPQDPRRDHPDSQMSHHVHHDVAQHDGDGGGPCPSDSSESSSLRVLLDSGVDSRPSTSGQLATGQCRALVTSQQQQQQAPEQTPQRPTFRHPTPPWVAPPIPPVADAPQQTQQLQQLQQQRVAVVRRHQQAQSSSPPPSQASSRGSSSQGGASSSTAAPATPANSPAHEPGSDRETRSLRSPEPTSRPSSKPQLRRRRSSGRTGSRGRST